MKFKNFVITTRVLKYVLDYPSCTIPEIKKFFGIKSSNPPNYEEKNLYKIITNLDNSGFIDKIDSITVMPRGAHYNLKATHKGSQIVLTFKKIFSDNKNKRNARPRDVSTEFSKLSYSVLNAFLQGFLNELPQDARWILRSKRPKFNILLEKSHMKLQNQVSKIIDSLT
jgi:hypothetical protein